MEQHQPTKHYVEKEFPNSFGIKLTQVYEIWSMIKERYGCYNLKNPIFTFDKDLNYKFEINHDTHQLVFNFFHIPRIIPPNMILWWIKTYIINHELAHYHDCPFSSEFIIKYIMNVEKKWNGKNYQVMHLLNFFYDLIVDYNLSYNNEDYIKASVINFNWVKYVTELNGLQPSYMHKFYVRIMEKVWGLKLNLFSMKEEEENIASIIANKIKINKPRLEILETVTVLLKHYIEKDYESLPNNQNVPKSCDVKIPKQSEIKDLMEKQNMSSPNDIFDNFPSLKDDKTDTADKKDTNSKNKTKPDNSKDGGNENSSDESSSSSDTNTKEDTDAVNDQKKDTDKNGSKKNPSNDVDSKDDDPDGDRKDGYTDNQNTTDKTDQKSNSEKTKPKPITNEDVPIKKLQEYVTTEIDKIPSSQMMMNNRPIPADQFIMSNQFDPKLKSNISENPENSRVEMINCIIDEMKNGKATSGYLLDKYNLVTGDTEKARYIFRYLASEFVEYNINDDKYTHSERNSLKQWNWSDSPKKYNILKSLNVNPIYPFPPNAKQWSYKRGVEGNKGKDYKDLVIAIDSSASMYGISKALIKKGRCDSIFDYALLSAFSLIKSVIQKNVKLSVINFSSKVIVERWSKLTSTMLNKMENILMHNQNSGTTFPYSEMKQLIEKNKNSVVVMITDFQLQNRSQFDLFHDYALKHKVPIIVLKITESSYKRYDNSLNMDFKKPGMNIIEITDKNDLINLSLKITRDFYR